METFSVLLTLCAGNPPVTSGWFTSQRPVTRSFDVFLDLRLNKLFSKQTRRRWFETPSRWLWRHCYVLSAGTLMTMFELRGLTHESLTHWGRDKIYANLRTFFKNIFLFENRCILILISPKFVLKRSIDNKSVLVLLMTCCWTGDKPLPQPIMIKINDAYMRHPAWMS